MALEGAATFLRLGYGILCAAVLCSGCAKDVTKPDLHEDSPLRYKATVDWDPTWSPDGRYIAFRRAFPSIYGPRGVYVIPVSGGPARFLTPADLIWPHWLRFSPDGTRIAGVTARQIVVIDVATGEATYPFYTENQAIFPDWSPDGQRLVYQRVFVYGYPPQPADSGGLHIYDFRTGEDRPIVHDGQVLFGKEPRWSPTGEYIAYIEVTNRWRVMLTTPDGSKIRELSVWQSNAVSNLHWYRRLFTGEDGLVFLVGGFLVGSPYQTWFVSVDGSRLVRRHLLVSNYDFSRDGSRLVTSGFDPRDSLGVLFIQSVDDFSGASRLQLTHYEPPPTYAAGSPASGSLTSLDGTWEDHDHVSNRNPSARGSAPFAPRVGRSRTDLDLGRLGHPLQRIGPLHAPGALPDRDAVAP